MITGGADGLGFALACRLAAKGAHLVLLDRDDQKLKKACEFLPDGSASAHQVDVTDASAVLQAVESVLESRKRIEALVNCAGIVGKTNIKSHEVDLCDFERVFRVNVMGCLTTFQAVVPHMLSAGYGRVLHVSSISGKEGNAGMLAYSTSKAAVIGMTKVQGKEYATTGITVNALAPAVVRTELVANMPPEQVRYMTDKIPMQRCGELEEFAAMAEFIISPENSFTTGFTFDLSGGRAVY
jgi:NAD(P)-dependent dehydrogenase (short-subunit alcohol dehydrogenase family)